MTHSTERMFWPGSGPYRRASNESLFIVEKRKLQTQPMVMYDGRADAHISDYRPLDFSDPQPPRQLKGYLTEFQISRHYYRTTQDKNARCLAWIWGWLEAQGFFVRAVTW